MGFGTLVYFLGSLFLGWGLGANDSANVFGTAVSSRMVTYRVAVICTAFFVVLGAVLQGANGIETLAHSLSSESTSSVKVDAVKSGDQPSLSVKQESSYSRNLDNAVIMSLAAAFTVFVMTLMKLPVSTSQSVVGAIIGVGLMRGDVNLAGLEKVVLCWIGTPLGSMLFTVIFYFIFKKILKFLNPGVLHYDRVMKILLVVAGCYGAYALGANNVANVTAVFVTSGFLTVKQAALFGGIAIALGVVTYSKPVMMTVGNDIIKLDAFMAFVTVLSLSLTVYIYALVGVPVSTTQAIVGAVLGLGVIKGIQTVNFTTLKKISIGWIITPIMGGGIAALGYFVSNLRYFPH